MEIQAIEKLRYQGQPFTLLTETHHSKLPRHRHDVYQPLTDAIAKLNQVE